MLQQWKTPACATRKSVLDSEIEVMSCVSIQTVFWLNVCQDQWSSWGISGLCFFIQGWPNLWINRLIDWKKLHRMLSKVGQKRANLFSNTIFLEFSGHPWLWWIIKSIISKQKNCILNTCTLWNQSCVQTVWIFTLKSFRSIWLLMDALRNKQNVLQGLATWLAQILYWDQLRDLQILVSDHCYTCVLPWKKRVLTCFSVSFHLLHCQARADVVAFWVICGRPRIHAWYAAQPSSTRSRCFLSSLLNSSVHHSCVVKWDLVAKSIYRGSHFFKSSCFGFVLSGCGRSLANDSVHLLTPGKSALFFPQCI